MIHENRGNDIDLDFILDDLPKALLLMEVGTDRIRQIVLSLRNFSRLDKAEFKAVDIHEGIDSTLLILGHRLKACTHQDEVEVVKQYGEIPPIECYPAQLNQVFMNLLANGLDAIEEAIVAKAISSTDPSSKNVPRISISTEVHELNQVEIRICDNGMGMAEDTQSKIFEHFFTTKPLGKGTGLGLAISKQITEKHQGTLSCSLVPGQGTEFRIRLPIKLQG